MIEIIERYSCAKSGREEKNEDGIFVSADFVAVVDGSTAKDDILFEDKSSGRLMRDIVLNALESLAPEADYKEAFVHIQEKAIAAFPKKEGWHGAAVAVIYSAFRKELWLIGDCQALADGRHIKNDKRSDEAVSEVRSFIIEALLDSGVKESDLLKEDQARKILLPALVMQKYVENRKGEWSYVVFDNEEYDLDFCLENIKVVKVEDSAEVILASDGYPVLKATLEESEAELQRILREDPLCCREFKSTKGLKEGCISFDDRTYIRFRDR